MKELTTKTSYAEILMFLIFLRYLHKFNTNTSLRTIFLSFAIKRNKIVKHNETQFVNAVGTLPFHKYRNKC